MSNYSAENVSVVVDGSNVEPKTIASRRHLASVTFDNPAITFNVFVDRIATEKDLEKIRSRIEKKVINSLVDGCRSHYTLADEIARSVADFMLESNKISVEYTANQ